MPEQPNELTAVDVQQQIAANLRCEFMVLGFHGSLFSDSETEADNPFIFNSIEQAVKVFKACVKENGFGTLVKLEVLEEVVWKREGNTCQS